VNPSIARQSVEQLGGEASVLARQRRDHATLEQLMRRYESGGGSPGERQRVLRDLVRLTFSHAFAEETVLWPALRRLAPDGEALTARVEDEHRRIDDLVTEMERIGADDPRHDALAVEAFALIRQDIRDEEDLLLPRLQEHLDRARLRRLGSAWETVRRTAPTRPHPAVPRRPPGNVLLGVPLSAFDRARGLLPVGAGSPAGRRAAVALACLAAAWALTRAARRDR
jgi:hemerythrin superfamily protein